MTDRITEAELREMEAEIQREIALGAQGGPVDDDRLIAEVRRLRELVTRLSEHQGFYSYPTRSSEAGEFCYWCNELEPKHGEHKRDCPWPEVETEAEAIAEESR